MRKRDSGNNRLNRKKRRKKKHKRKLPLLCNLMKAIKCMKEANKFYTRLSLTSTTTWNRNQQHLRSCFKRGKEYKGKNSFFESIRLSRTREWCWASLWELKVSMVKHFNHRLCQQETEIISCHFYHLLKTQKWWKQQDNMFDVKSFVFSDIKRVKCIHFCCHWIRFLMRSCNWSKPTLREERRNWRHKVICIFLIKTFCWWW